MASNDIAIVILNWNGKHFLEKFLPSVVINAEGAHVYIADNGSTDDSISFVKNHYPTISILQFDKNYGFCGGYNKALAEIKSKYYVLLNSDVETPKGWIAPLYNLLENDQTIGACQPNIKSYDNKTLFEHAGAAGGFIDWLGYPFCRGRIFLSLEEDKQQYNDNKEVFWASGACMFVRSELFHKAGGLDNDFFAHMEEIDLCWRIKNLGYKIYSVGNSEVYHVGGGTLPKSNPRKTYLNFRNGLSMLVKNLSRKRLIYVLPLRMILDGIASVHFLLAGYPKDSYAVFNAHMGFYKTLGLTLKKRKLIQKNIKRCYHNEIYDKSIVVQHFVKKINRYSEL